MSGKKLQWHTSVVQLAGENVMVTVSLKVKCHENPLMVTVIEQNAGLHAVSDEMQSVHVCMAGKLGNDRLA